MRWTRDQCHQIVWVVQFTTFLLVNNGSYPIGCGQAKASAVTKPEKFISLQMFFT